MAETTDLERAIAALVLGGLSPDDEARVRERLRRNPAARRLEQQMRQTLGALGTWREAHEALPRPAIPAVRRFPGRFLLPLAAAAAVLLAAAVWLLMPKPLESELSRELARASSGGTAPKDMWTYTPPAPARSGGPGDPKGGPGFGAATQGGARTGGPGGTDGGEGGGAGAPKPGGLIGGAPPRVGESGGPRIGAPARGGAGAGHAAAGAAPPRDLAAFVRQFDFAFRVPETLPGGWKLTLAAPAGKSSLTLAYTVGTRHVPVSVSASPGPDVAPAVIRTLVAARRGGVLVAFPREAFPENLRGQVVEAFLK